MTSSPGPEAVLRIASGVRQAQVLFTSLELGVFDMLAEGPLSADELAERRSLHPRAVRDLLAALHALGLLERDFGGYRLAPAADTYLVRGRPAHLGGFLAFLDGVLHPAWRGLTQSVRTGQAVRTGDPYDGLYDSAADRDGFLDAMDVLNSPLAAQLAEYDWHRYRSFVDVGGARGNLAAQIAKAHPNLDAQVFDLPGLSPAFDRHMAALGLTGAVSFTAGDFFADPLPAADVVIFGHVLHNWPEERRDVLLAKAYEAVSAGGAVLVYDPMIDEHRPQLPNVLASLNMLVWSEGGSEYPVGDLRARLFAAGFATVTASPIGATGTLVAARKAA
ncbi:methyltransferase [Streptomyces sp. NPDC001034]|uniref:methyltransferase n=1 Tax=Streptomyces sp. NPDC001034 TaxID=3154375 RepID=UPI00332A9929